MTTTDPPTPPPQFKPPFFHCDGYIMAERTKGNGETIALEVRGWGYLTGPGWQAHGMTDKDAAAVQDQFGEWVAATLNKAAEEDQS